MGGGREEEEAHEEEAAVVLNELGVAGTRVHVSEFSGVVFMVTSTQIAIAFDDYRSAAISHADFNAQCFKELTFDPNTAIVGVLVGAQPQDGGIAPSGFLYEVHQPSPPWQLYSRYVPAREGPQFAIPPLSFPLDAGDAVVIHKAVQPVSSGKAPLRVRVGGSCYFLGLVRADERVWALVCTPRLTHSHPPTIFTLLHSTAHVHMHLTLAGKV